MTAPDPHPGPAPVLNLIEQQARVVAVVPGLAWLETSRRGACGSCSSSSGCATQVFGSLAGSSAARARIQVADHLGLRVGDGVVVGIPDGALTQAAALAYLFPPALLVLAAAGAGAFGLGDLGSALIGLIGLAMGLGLTRFLTGGAAACGAYRPILVRRQSSGPSVAFNFQQIERGIES
jgi:sigma-E factor negative regulatory protein RseC